MLQQRGYRITPQREMIIEAIAHSNAHMTVEDVFDTVHTRTKSLNRATVYRVLDFLVKEGLTSRIDLGGGRVVYASIRHGPHIHLVCRQCGKIIEASQVLLTPLEEQIKEEYHFDADITHFSIHGICADCQQT